MQFALFKQIASTTFHVGLVRTRNSSESLRGDMAVADNPRKTIGDPLHSYDGWQRDRSTVKERSFRDFT